MIWELRLGCYQLCSLRYLLLVAFVYINNQQRCVALVVERRQVPMLQLSNIITCCTVHLQCASLSELARHMYAVLVRIPAAIMSVLATARHDCMYSKQGVLCMPLLPP